MAAGPAYRIETERLVVRAWAASDAVRANEAIEGSLEHLRRWLGWARTEPLSLEARKEQLRRYRRNFEAAYDFVYGVFPRDESCVMGGAALFTRLGPEARELGYWVRGDAVRRGIATEAAGALTKIAFEVDGAARVELRCDAGNEGSIAVARKLGFQCDGKLHERLSPSSAGRELLAWSILRDEYPASLPATLPIRAFNHRGAAVTLRPVPSADYPFAPSGITKRVTSPASRPMASSRP
jgi:RimJ/RimL family protein N-acetyltransferase